MYKMTHFKRFSDKEFKEFCKYIYDNVGINLTDKKYSLVHNRLRSRLVKYNFNSYGDYFNFVKEDKENDELTNLINAITTNVTTFFRDRNQFNTFSQLVLPYFEQKHTNINIWSAGCSTGEEPYSIAIEILKHTTNIKFKIHATDISTKVLDSASAGIYSKEQIKTVEEHYLRRFFIKRNDKFEVLPKVKENVQFYKLNLVEDKFPPRMDIVFCRNVVIYFDKDTRDKLYKKFYDSLNQDGFFFVGHSESLFTNKLFKFFRPSVYKKA